MQITRDQLAKIFPMAKSRIDKNLPFINSTLLEFGIDTPMRVAAFLAQIGHESAQLYYVEEIASGEAYDTGNLAKRLGNTPEKDGDGQRYKGRGYIQTTGWANYSLCAKKFNKTMDELIEWLKTPEGACRSSGYFWSRNGLNKVADTGSVEAVTKIVNGGKNGLEERIKYYNVALKVLS